MMPGQGQRFKLFRLFGVPIFAEPSVLILFLIFILLMSGSGAAGTVAGLIFCVVAFVSIILHELGHAIAIQKLGYGQSVIVLHGLGGVTQWRGKAKRRDRILISLAGPAAGLIVGGIALAFVLPLGYPREFALDQTIRAILFINIGWSIFNLMPIYPLDGGHVVRDVLSTPARSKSQVLQTSLKVSMIAGGGLLVLALVTQWIFVAVLLGLILYNNYREWQQIKGPPASFYGY